MPDIFELTSELKKLGLGEVIRQDASFTATLDKQLRFVKAQTYDIKYPEMKARGLIPVNNSVGNGAETIVYRQWDGFGAAQIIANYADDLPNADVKVQEFVSKIQSIGSSYEWSIQDLRRSQMAGSQLDVRRASMARRAIENKIEDVAAFGDVDGGLSGFFNQANITPVGPVNGDWITSTDPFEIIEDLNALVNSIVIGSKETFLPDTIVMDITTYTILNTRPMSTTGDTTRTILTYFLENNPYIRNIETWFKAALADVGGDGPRMVCYKRDPEVLTLEIPQEYESFPPQARNLAFVVPNHARVAGVILYYPIAMAYMDDYLA